MQHLNLAVDPKLLWKTFCSFGEKKPQGFDLVRKESLNGQFAKAHKWVNTKSKSKPQKQKSEYVVPNLSQVLTLNYAMQKN